MGVMIGGSDGYSTWGRCRTPILKPVLWTAGSHNFTANAFFSQAYTFFRASSWAYLNFWTDGSGNTQVEFVGPIAQPGAPYPASPAFKVSSINYDPFGALSSNLLDDVEVQNYWVGRNVVIDASTYTMSYSALDGLAGSFQSITTSSDVVSFDL